MGSECPSGRGTQGGSRRPKTNRPFHSFLPRQQSEWGPADDVSGRRTTFVLAEEGRSVLGNPRASVTPRPCPRGGQTLLPPNSVTVPTVPPYSHVAGELPSVPLSSPVTHPATVLGGRDVYSEQDCVDLSATVGARLCPPVEDVHHTRDTVRPTVPVTPSAGPGLAPLAVLSCPTPWGLREPQAARAQTPGPVKGVPEDECGPLRTEVSLLRAHPGTRPQSHRSAPVSVRPRGS